MTAEEALANPPVQQPPALGDGNSDADVRARFRASQEAVKETEPKPEPTPEPQPPKVEEKKTDEIPAEFFDAPKTEEEDDLDKVIQEETQGGKITNKSFTRATEAAKLRIAKLKAELEETRSKLPKDDFVPEKINAKLTDLEKKLQEKDEILTRKYVEDSPAFRERFTTKEESIINRLNKTAKDLELPNRVIKSLLSTDSVKERAEILEAADLGHVAISSITTLLDQYDGVEAEKSAYLSDIQARRAELEAQELQERDKQKAKIKEVYDRAFEDVLSDVQKNNSIFKKTGNEQWDRQTEEIIQNARELYNAENSTPHKDAEAFLGYAAARRASAMLEKATALYRETKKELDELKAAGPGGGHGVKTTTSDPMKDMSPDQRAAATFNNERAKALNGYAG